MTDTDGSVRLATGARPRCQAAIARPAAPLYLQVYSGLCTPCCTPLFVPLQQGVQCTPAVPT